MAEQQNRNNIRRLTRTALALLPTTTLCVLGVAHLMIPSAHAAQVSQAMGILAGLCGAAMSFYFKEENDAPAGPE